MNKGAHIRVSHSRAVKHIFLTGLREVVGLMSVNCDEIFNQLKEIKRKIVTRKGKLLKLCEH